MSSKVTHNRTLRRSDVALVFSRTGKIRLVLPERKKNSELLPANVLPALCAAILFRVPEALTLVRDKVTTVLADEEKKP
jgi:hypothetical protein